MTIIVSSDNIFAPYKYFDGDDDDDVYVVNKTVLAGRVTSANYSLDAGLLRNNYEDTVLVRLVLVFPLGLFVAGVLLQVCSQGVHW